MQIIFRIDFTLCVLLVSVWMLFKLEVYIESSMHWDFVISSGIHEHNYRN